MKQLQTKDLINEFFTGASGTQKSILLKGVILGLSLQKELDLSKLVDANDQTEQIRLIREALDIKSTEESRRAQEAVDATLQKIYDKSTPDDIERITQQVRAFVLDRNRVGDDGIAYNNKSEPLEDSNFNPLPGKTISLWPTINMVHETTGVALDPTEHKKLTAEEQKCYFRKTYFHLDVPGENAHVLDADAVDYLAPFVARDMRKNFAVALRYATELVYDSKEGTIGKLVPYRATVIKALEETGKLEFKSTAVSTQLSLGYIGSIEELNIAVLEVLSSNAISADDLATAEPSDIQRYLDLVEAARVTDVDEFKKHFSDKSIDHYKDANGKGMQACENIGTDSNPIWQCTRINISRNGQRQYIRYMAREIVNKLFAMIVANKQVQSTHATPQSKQILGLYAALCM